MINFRSSLWSLVLTLNVSFICAEESIIFHGQGQQDRFVYENFFKNKLQGVFVDIGAHDGIKFSNTYFFEKHLGWTGMCVEPLPEVFERLKANRKCLCVQGCIFDKYETVPFLKISGYPEMLSGIIENYDPQHVRRIQTEIAMIGGKSEIITVKCYNLTKLLIDNNIHHVDYLSIDTEGGELGILKSIDFTRIDVEIIDVENNYNEPFQQFLEPFGYRKVAMLGVDEIYKKKHKIDISIPTDPYLKQTKLLTNNWMRLSQ
ncbi:MAG: FkbM family methyltransferase [Parachlamydiaceae bacterium]